MRYTVHGTLDKLNPKSSRKFKFKLCNTLGYSEEEEELFLFNRAAIIIS